MEQENNMSNITLHFPTEVVGSNAMEKLWLSKNALTAVEFPAGTTSIDGMMFNGQTALASVTLDASLERIGSTNENAIPNPNEMQSNNVGVFSGTTSLTSITFPSSLKSISNFAFAGSGLTSVSIGKNVKNIGKKAFAADASLASVTYTLAVYDNGSPQYASQVRVSGLGTFMDCSSLTSVTINHDNSVNGNYAMTQYSLPERMFANCTSLEVLDIDEPIQFIGSGFVYGCTNLKKLILRNPNIVEIFNYSTSYDDMSEWPSQCVIYVPDDLVSSYSTADYKESKGSTNGSEYTRCALENGQSASVKLSYGKKWKAFYDAGRLKPISELNS